VLLHSPIDWMFTYVHIGVFQEFHRNQKLGYTLCPWFIVLYCCFFTDMGNIAVAYITWPAPTNCWPITCIKVSLILIHYGCHTIIDWPHATTGTNMDHITHFYTKHTKRVTYVHGYYRGTLGVHVSESKNG